ncbi:hypothetical protein L6452_30659 [Arctium lappa]|uniref:Uncharacterized protein n=1 Tax=Arctium lappa TaxID=4217 RepID=A0ACB8ZIK6_ARCLA|nr:hypothetical protein L6452_30659 [Arctium lappa]
MIHALGFALLCVNSTPEERSTMKDVAAMLKEIKQEKDQEYAKVDALLKGAGNNGGSPRTGIPAPSSSSPNHKAGNNLNCFSPSLFYLSSSSSWVCYKPWSLCVEINEPNPYFTFL